MHAACHSGRRRTRVKPPRPSTLNVPGACPCLPLSHAPTPHTLPAVASPQILGTAAVCGIVPFLISFLPPRVIKRVRPGCGLQRSAVLHQTWAASPARTATATQRPTDPLPTLQPLHPPPLSPQVFPPIVCGVTICLIGINLCGVGMKASAGVHRASSRCTAALSQRRGRGDCMPCPACHWLAGAYMVHTCVRVAASPPLMLPHLID